MKKEIPIAARTQEQLILELGEGMAPKWLFFWGHTPAQDGSIGKSCFSQWREGHPFQDSGFIYRTAEHFMMAQKARLFGDSKALSAILHAESPALAKKIGRTVNGFSEAAWLDARWEIVVEGNLLKFSQHPDLKSFLLRTGDRILVEASPFDPIWGIGLASSDAGIENPAQRKGLNLLGFALMEIRAQLKLT